MIFRSCFYEIPFGKHFPVGLFFLLGMGLQTSLAQNPIPPTKITHNDSARYLPNKFYPFSGYTQVDLIDVGRWLVNRNNLPRMDTSGIKTGKFHFSVLPSVEYTLQTGFAVLATANLAFYTSNAANANISSIVGELKFTQKHQVLVPIAASIWTPGNKFNIQTDWRFEKFPQTTYGLGQFTTAADGYTIDYSYMRLYQTVVKTILPDFYLGLGYNLDYYWNVQEVNPPPGDTTDFQKYGLSTHSVSSGVTFNMQYDTRRNSINPQGGNYANVVYRYNSVALGSDDSWQSVIVDLRKYIRFPSSSRNIIAFWSYNWLTVAGKPPYLSLPITAGDTYNNLGRGYIQARFRGSNLVYLETEYRFGITTNGLIGAAVFANAQTFSSPDTHLLQVISPGWGGGIRIKLNKFSKTNICLDYGWGAHGSRGIFANLGEVF